MVFAASVAPSALPVSLGTLGLLVAAGLVVYHVATAFYSWWRMRHIPGPILGHISYLWLTKVQRSGRMGYIYRDLPHQYGSLVRIAPNAVTTDDPEVIRRLNSVRSRYNRDPWYLAGRWNPYTKHMFNELEPPGHDAMKARVIGAYSGKDVDGLEGSIEGQIKGMIDLVRRKYLSDEKNFHELDLALICSYFTLDVITKVGCGEAFGYLRTDSDLFNFLGELRSLWWIVGLTLDIPWIRNLVYGDTFIKLFGPKKTDKGGFGRLMRLAAEIVDVRYSPGAKDERDMLGAFIRNGLTQDECEHECIFLITAGADNSSTAIRCTLLHIISSPQVYLELKHEIFSAIREGRASNPITYEEARRIPYLQAVIYEGLRMRPPTPGLFLKAVPPEGDYIDGKFIPGGVGVGANVSAMLASKTLWGEDAALFRPGRFLEVSEEQREEMERNVELIFGYGRWMCIGKNVVWLELYKVYFELLRHFDFQLLNPTKPWDSKSWQVWVEENFMVKVTESRTDY
ncbi:pisatin demethylase [Lasiosphaeria hispida]|uniref:Pisatin demethylase n=1 Tax=Lasiosphaeria hispida TaxID=260671 RepID=A0AAJ0MJ60_9PEZI|nr:pisatin demethylase [Lasiosphaeria hispida]